MSDSQAKLMQSETENQQGKFLTFRVDEEVYGIEINYVTGIIDMQKINVLPQSPDFIKGIINLRGQIIPVVDMRLRFKKKAVPYSDRTCIIVVEVMETTAGFIVDQVEEVVDISDDMIVSVPEFQQSYRDKFVKSIGRSENEIRLLLDCERVFLYE